MRLRTVYSLGWPLLLFVCASSTGCAGPNAANGSTAKRAEWAIAIHGGAGVLERDRSAEEIKGYRDALSAALDAGRQVLASGGTSLDAVERVVQRLEDDERFNAGKGAVFTSAGTCELDAAIMDGRKLTCGAVSGLRIVKNPILLARRVMEKSRHVFLVGEGAEHFAAEQGLERVPNEYFHTERQRKRWQKVVDEEKRNSARAAPPSYGTVGAAAPRYGTVGAVALDRFGNLAAATSTGGLTNKRYGRVGDTPIIGAGTYADNASCAVSCTGTGELFIRHGVAHRVAMLMEYGGLSLGRAVHQVIHERLSPQDGGLIAVDRAGRIVLDYNTDGMYRGAADSAGRFEVKIWEE
ncbi:MAG: isoaspartyl peptidase/L-asparaginase family protein [Planctomycetota bacterium]